MPASPLHLTATPPAWLTARHLAERLQVSNRILEDWRRQGLGPLPVKFGEARNSPVQYGGADVLAWEGSDEGRVLLAAAGDHHLLDHAPAAATL
jgi:hypothetical protein